MSKSEMILTKEDKEKERIAWRQLENIIYKQIERVSEVSQKSTGIKLTFLTFSMGYLIKQSKEAHLFSCWE